jgi:hypothetical protein
VKIAVPMAAACFAALAAVAVFAQSDATPFGKIPKARVRTFVSPVANIKVEYPASGDWTLLPGPTGTVLALAEYKKGEALVVIERVPLTEPLAADELAPVADREARLVKEREAAATGFSQQVLDADKRKVIVVRYTRAGNYGPEQVVLYAVPQGTALYRVTCMVAAAQIAKYLPLFGHIAASIEPALPPKPK